MTTVSEIKDETFARLKSARQLWMIEECGASFIVHQWTGEEWINGEGVAPSSEYPTLRKAAARLLQLLHIGPVAPQTWPEEACLGEVTPAPNHAGENAKEGK